MWIKKYDADYTRRAFLEKTAKGMFMGGVLAPLWPTIAKAGDISKAYPAEALSIETYSKGKVKEGDVVDAGNVDAVKDLLDPIAYKQIKEMGRKVNIKAPTTDITKLFPHEYMEATLRNKGQATFDSNGNITTKDGKPWIGGNPFPEATNGVEAMANITLSWGRHDSTIYAIRDWDINPSGETSYQYDFVWAELNTTGRLYGEPYLPGEESKLRYQSAIFTAPNDTKGTSYLNVWSYDQREFPALSGYLPAFKRVRNFPASQRFEPLVPGVTFFLSDAWAAGDPMLTWGNYKIVETKPHLGIVNGNFMGSGTNWERPVHGGPKGQTFFDTTMELCPEVLVVEAEPVGYPRSPVGKKRVYIDVRNQMFVAYVTYDRRGEIWKSFEPAFSTYEKGSDVVKTGSHPRWSWTHVMSHDIQSNRMSRFVQAEKITGGYKSDVNVDNIYDKYLTNQAIQSLGR